MNPARLAAVVCLLLLLAAFAGRVLSSPEVFDPGEPRTNQPAVMQLAAVVAPIGDFAREFSVNDENPFIPHRERIAEIAEIRQGRVRTPVASNAPPPVGPPVVVEKPVMKWSKAKAVELTLPECLGLIAHPVSRRQILIARLPGGPQQQIEVGGRIGEWELTGISRQGARLRDTAGVEHEVPFTIVDPPLPVQKAPAEGAAVPTPPPGDVPAPQPPAQVDATPPPAPPAPPTPPRPDGREARGQGQGQGWGGLPRDPRDGQRRDGNGGQPPMPRPAPDMVPLPPR